MPETAAASWTPTPGLTETYELSLTTQGPLYPPSEVMDADGNFVVVGMINRTTRDGAIRPEWGAAVVSPDSPLPEFGGLAPYTVVRELDTAPDGADKDIVLHTLPLPLPCNNYPMVFAPEQLPEAERVSARVDRPGVVVEVGDRVLQGLTADEPHRVVRPAVAVGSEGVDRDDPRVLQVARDLGLEQEPLAAGRVVGVVVEDLF